MLRFLSISLELLMGKTGLVYDSRFLDHDMGMGHPESPHRLRAIMQHLEQTGTLQRVTRIEPRRAEDEWVTQIHQPEYVAALTKHAPTHGRVSLDPDTSMSPGSLTAAYLAAGGALAAVDAIMNHKVDHVFCAVRPPGHHAESGRAMGFCLFNNIAIGALRAREVHGLARAAVIDFDVHHGNGTQARFESDASLFYASTHQYPLYPGTGAASETGVGNIVNVPLRPMSGSREFRLGFTREILPALDTFRPEMLLISAGFDAHRSDPLAQLLLDETDYT